MKKTIVVLGSTGSIGRQTLDVVRAMPDAFRILALSAGGNAAALLEQAWEFRPAYLGIHDKTQATLLSGTGAQVVAGEEAAGILAALPEAEIVVNGVCGFAGLAPLLAALGAKKTVALANKESIVCAHALVEAALERGGRIIPVDSEQSALYQCLRCGEAREVSRLILTASGGPFRTYTQEQLQRVGPADALRHPTWAMGKKITVDSASLFNKGLEIMEAAYLFHIAGERIDVLLHPESIVHSMVEFADGSNIAQLSAPDMRLPLQYALTMTERKPGGFGKLDLGKVGTLHFEAPDYERFPALPLAYAALREGGALPIAYNGANEVAAALFLEGNLPFMDIPVLVEHAMAKIERIQPFNMEGVLEIDGQARRLALEKAGRPVMAERKPN
ncbi:MAG: 1-deoxy-D-xylulose-5-phosphate reductoisomerase [Candidatus Pelethousia sp.]|nr:1-deoxy-D-xylulose-5-phosphate reductoisomerase [Candidatus Pelethousia sp.]